MICFLTEAMLWKTAGGPADLGTPGHLGNVPGSQRGEACYWVLATIHGKTSFLLTFPAYPETRSLLTLALLSGFWDFCSG